MKNYYNQFVTLEYSYGWNCWHIDNELNKRVVFDWVTIANPVVEEVACLFIEFMEKKYVTGRKHGKLPPLEIVKKEFELFEMLDARRYRRKLVGYENRNL